jgi:hypothetical protein
MIMKRFIALTLFMLAANCVLAQINANEHEWKATIKVVDESGAPFFGALATIGYYTNSVSTVTDGITDTNGIFTLTHTAHSEYADISFEAKKDGYYSIWQQVNLQAPYEEAKWNPTKTLVLKKIAKPIAMYAKKYAMALKLPEYGKPTAYDLEIGDWVGPYGKGVNKDIIFQKDYSDKAAEGYYSKVTVSFPKDGDGIQVYNILDSEMGSGLLSPHEAPQDGYQPAVTREVSALRGQPSKNEHDPNRIYFFRVRTVKDHEGNIVSAHYGKIYGDFMQFTYYLNPTPNDRNIEFDPKQNLLGGLQSFEGVNAP